LPSAATNAIARTSTNANAKTKENDEKQLRVIEELIQLFENKQNDHIVRKMKEIVPEYIRNNSEFLNLQIIVKNYIFLV
jgi:hypothetical protein